MVYIRPHLSVNTFNMVKALASIHPAFRMTLSYPSGTHGATRATTF